jgi:hypothetical protein
MPAPRIPRTVARGKPKPNFRRRIQHLAFVRQLPCVACGKAAPSDATHVRTGTDGGVGMKPGVRYAVPLCTACHAKQHRVGELTFWSGTNSVCGPGCAEIGAVHAWLSLIAGKRGTESANKIFDLHGSGCPGLGYRVRFGHIIPIFLDLR